MSRFAAALTILAVVWTALVVSLVPAPLEPCVEEDGSGQASCYWDGSEQGNGAGSDYIIVEGVTYYPEG